MLAEVTVKANKSGYKKCGITPHFYTGQDVLKKLMRKDK